MGVKAGMALTLLLFVRRREAHWGVKAGMALPVAICICT